MSAEVTVRKYLTLEAEEDRLLKNLIFEECKYLEPLEVNLLAI